MGYKGSEFYNNSFKKWLKCNDIELHSIHKEGKSVIAERWTYVINDLNGEDIIVTFYE